MLDSIAQGQQSRTVLADTHKIYISKCRVMTRILNEIPDIRNDALELSEDGRAIEHIGDAKGVFKLKLPLDKIVPRGTASYIGQYTMPHKPNSFL